MSEHSLTKQVEETFKVLGKEEGKDFLKSVQELVAKAGENTERTIILIFALIVVFFLIDLDLALEGDFFIIELKDLSPLRILLPIVVGYMYFDLITNVSKVERLSKIYRIIIKTMYPQMRERELADYFIFVPNVLEFKYSRSKLSLALWRVSFFIILLSPLVFEVYAICRLLNLFSFEFSVFFGVVFSILCTLILCAEGTLRLSNFAHEVFRK